MATRNEEVMEMVRQELERQPGVASRELFERAKEMDPEIGNLSLQQFHARYPLQASRRGGGASGGAGGQQRRKRARKGTRTAAAESSAAAETPAGDQAQGRQRRGRRRAQAAEGGNRDAVRSIFLRFASDFAQAETRPEIVGVLSNVDGYVDEVIRLTESS